MDELEAQLRATQAAVQKATDSSQKARARRQKAVLEARAANWSKYRIAAVLGVKAPTVDSIIKAAEKEAGDA
jgi:DNA-directed RNA polymerase specialized sigma24 family protein